MVSVEEDVGNNRPGLVPGQVFFVDEDSHQLRDGEGRMGLSKHLVRKMEE